MKAGMLFYNNWRSQKDFWWITFAIKQLPGALISEIGFLGFGVVFILYISGDLQVTGEGVRFLTEDEIAKKERDGKHN